MEIFLTKEKIGRPRCRWLRGIPIFEYLNENGRVRETVFASSYGAQVEIVKEMVQKLVTLSL